MTEAIDIVGSGKIREAVRETLQRSPAFRVETTLPDRISLLLDALDAARTKGTG